MGLRRVRSDASVSGRINGYVPVANLACKRSETAVNQPDCPQLPSDVRRPCLAASSIVPRPADRRTAAEEADLAAL